MVLNVMCFYEMAEEGRKVLKRTDYSEKNKKPKINWEDSGKKAELLEGLVKDALALVFYVRGQKEIKDDLKEAVDLLEKIALQDVDIDKDGHVTMKQGTAKDRIISVNDPEMRHGRKTSSKLSDGYKAEIITGGENASIVIGIAAFFKFISLSGTPYLLKNHSFLLILSKKRTCLQHKASVILKASSYPR